LSDILNQVAFYVEAGKINKSSLSPPNMKDQDGNDELANKTLEQGCKPDEILEKALILAMVNVGNKFNHRKIYVPQMLLFAKAMNGSMIHLKPYFQSGEKKGTLENDLF
jgi:methanogenic corrinoid protein MtbC1